MYLTTITDTSMTNANNVGEHADSQGKIKCSILSSDESNALTSSGIILPSHEVNFFSRLMVNGVKYGSALHGRDGNGENYFVSLHSLDGLIRYGRMNEFEVYRVG